MKKIATFIVSCGSFFVVTLLVPPGVMRGQTVNPPAGAPPKVPAPLNWTVAQDHKNMMEQLGIVRLRPGPSGQSGSTNSANYDPAKANPFPDLPDILTLKNGQKVTTADMWWQQRRPEIVEDFEREVIGRVPKDVPKVTWTVVSNVVDGLVGNLSANGKQLIGHVDNSTCPSITVDIRMAVVILAHAKGPVPMLMSSAGLAATACHVRPALLRRRIGFASSAVPSRTRPRPSNSSLPVGATPPPSPGAFKPTTVPV
jgi:hypothetical protein